MTDLLPLEIQLQANWKINNDPTVNKAKFHNFFEEGFDALLGRKSSSSQLERSTKHEDMVSEITGQSPIQVEITEHSHITQTQDNTISADKNGNRVLSKRLSVRKWRFNFLKKWSGSNPSSYQTCIDVKTLIETSHVFEGCIGFLSNLAVCTDCITPFRALSKDCALYDSFPNIMDLVIFLCICIFCNTSSLMMVDVTIWSCTTPQNWNCCEESVAIRPQIAPTAIAWLIDFQFQVLIKILTGLVVLIFHRFLWIVAFLTSLSLPKKNPLGIGQESVCAVI